MKLYLVNKSYYSLQMTFQFVPTRSWKILPWDNSANLRITSTNQKTRCPNLVAIFSSPMDHLRHAQNFHCRHFGILLISTDPGKILPRGHSKLPGKIWLSKLMKLYLVSKSNSLQKTVQFVPTLSSKILPEDDSEGLLITSTNQKTRWPNLVAIFSLLMESSLSKSHLWELISTFHYFCKFCTIVMIFMFLFFSV